MEFSFHLYNALAQTGASMALSRLLGKLDAPPVVLCVGSDLAVGDCLGPLTGTLLRSRNVPRGYIYGTLKAPVTAKEIGSLHEFLKKTHPRSKIVAVDAAVGEESELGLVKLSDRPLRPGSGANKRLSEVGDISVLGIVAQRSPFPYASLNLTRLNVVYGMAELIAGALSELLGGGAKKSQNIV